MSGDAQAPVSIPRQTLQRSVVLIGLMGAGKSSVGARLAQSLGVAFRDSDAEVEAAANRSIAEIFENHGEAYFRDGERRVIARLIDGPPGVIATGGGAFMNAETRALLRARTVSVWLRADLETLAARTLGRTHRPLLNGPDPRGMLARLIEERYPVYAEADIAVDTVAGQMHEAMVVKITAALAAHPGAMG
ncbi:MAG: shikimate kinase [Pseudomonadota bacterium]